MSSGRMCLDLLVMNLVNIFINNFSLFQLESKSYRIKQNSLI